MQLKVVGFVSRCTCGFVAAMIVLVLSSPAAAQVTYTWDPSQTGSGSDGSGNWTSTAYRANSGSDVVWSDGNNAVFGVGAASAGTVAISGVVSPNSSTFNPAASGNYVISGGSINLFNAVTSITANTNATISSQLVGTGGITMSGTAALTLSGALSYTGSTIVNQGMLVLAGNSLNSSDLSIASGGTLQINSPSSATGFVGVETSITGGGVYQKTGPGLWDMGGVGTNKSVSLSQGALIDVEGGTLRLGFDLSSQCSWANNMAGLNVASGTIFDLWDSNTINVDALTGAGTVQAGEGSHDAHAWWWASPAARAPSAEPSRITAARPV